MERDIDGSLGCEMIRHESVKLRHDGLNIQWVFVQEQRRVVFLDNQCRLCGSLTVARFVLACADAVGAASVYAHEQILRRLHTPFPRDAQQSHLDIVDNGCHRDLRFTEQRSSQIKAFLNRRSSECPEMVDESYLLAFQVARTKVVAYTRADLPIPNRKRIYWCETL